jgi:hypothetical protein
MNEYIFGCGRGHLSAKVAKIAEDNGAALVHHTDTGCSCGRGHAAKCPANRRHWFVGANRGEPFDSQLAKRVLAAID